MRVFQRGETIGLWAYIKDWEGVYTTPDNGVKVTLTDPKGTVKVDNLPMTISAVGKLVYYYLSLVTDEIGWWKYWCKSQDGTGAEAKYTITKDGFQLE